MSCARYRNAKYGTPLLELAVSSSLTKSKFMHLNQVKVKLS